MNDYYVYILKCGDDSYYTGVTNNLEKRIKEHETGTDPNSYTFHRRPVTLFHAEIFHDINQAIAFEKQIKGWSRKKKEALANRDSEKLKELSACKNETHYRKLS
jgi:putative endonuclease